MLIPPWSTFPQVKSLRVEKQATVSCLPQMLFSDSQQQPAQNVAHFRFSMAATDDDENMRHRSTFQKGVNFRF